MMRRKNKRSIFDVLTFGDDNGGGSGEGGGGGQGGNGGGQGGAALDEARVNTIVNGAVGNMRKEFTKLLGDAVSPISTQMTEFGEILKALKPQQQGGGQGEGGSGAGKPDPETTAKMIQMERQIKANNDLVEKLQKENVEAKASAERADRHARIRSVLGGFQFISEDAAETAFELMEKGIRRDPESGNLIGGPEGAVLPFDVFIKEALNGKHAYLIGVKTGGGSGAVKGDARLAHSGTTVGTTEMIRPGMKAEERAAVVAAIQQVGQQLGGR